MSNERPNPEYNPTISLDKGITNAKSAGIGGALTTLLLVGVTLAQGGKLDEVAATGVVSAVVALGAAAVAGLGEWWRNRKKHSKVRRTGRLPVVLLIASLALGGALSGCETLTLRDGTVVQRLDTAALQWAYNALKDERDKPENAGRDWLDFSITLNGQVWDAAALERELAARGVSVGAQ